MTQEIIDLKKSVEKLKLKVNQLQGINNDLQISIKFHYRILDLLKKSLVNYCIAELDEKFYNSLILDIEGAIRKLREKDAHFSTQFNKRNLMRELFDEYADDTSIAIEPAVSIYLRQTHNKELDMHQEASLITFFKDRLALIKNINDKEESLRIINLN